MSPNPEDAKRNSCPFASLELTLYDQYTQGLTNVLFNEAPVESILSQHDINLANREFRNWNRQISVADLAQYVEGRCKQGGVLLQALLQPEKMVAPVFDSRIPDQASEQSPAQRIRDRTNLAVTHREACEFLEVLQKDPTIILAFQILQSFVGDYMQQLGSTQECPYTAMIFENLSEHYRHGDNFQRAIPISIYLASSPDERTSFTSGSLNSATAKKGLEYLQRLRMFSVSASDMHGEIVAAMPETERLFTCPAEPFLMKLFGETNVLETVVGFIRNGLAKKIIPKVIPDPVGPESQPSAIAVPNAMRIVLEFTRARVSLLAEFLGQKDETVWSNLAENRRYHQTMVAILNQALEYIQKDICRPEADVDESRPD